MKFVLLCGYHRDAFSDIIETNDIKYMYCPLNYRKGINGYLLSRKVLNNVPTWFLPRIYDRVFRGSSFRDLRRTDEVVFIFSELFALYGDYIFMDFVHSLMRAFPYSKYVFSYSEFIGRCGEYDYDLLERMKEEFDLLISGNKDDVKKYGIVGYYCGSGIKKYEDPPTETDTSDCFYVGCDAGRFDTQIKLFKKLSEMNLHCIFYISGVDQDNISRIYDYIQEIEEYADNRWKFRNSTLTINEYLPYDIVLSYVSRCKCLVEVLIEGQQSSTMRLNESVIYKKKLLTNCHDAVLNPAYCKNNMMIFDDPQMIEANEFIRFINSEYEEVDYEITSMRFFDFVKGKLYGDSKE